MGRTDDTENAVLIACGLRRRVARRSRTAGIMPADLEPSPINVADRRGGKPARGKRQRQALENKGKDQRDGGDLPSYACRSMKKPHERPLIARIQTLYGHEASERNRQFAVDAREAAQAMRASNIKAQNRGTNPCPAASTRPANGAPTWPGSVSAPVAAQSSSTLRRLARASSASEFFGKFQCG